MLRQLLHRASGSGGSSAPSLAAFTAAMGAAAKRGLAVTQRVSQGGGDGLVGVPVVHHGLMGVKRGGENSDA